MKFKCKIHLKKCDLVCSVTLLMVAHTSRVQGVQIGKLLSFLPLSLQRTTIDRLFVYINMIHFRANRCKYNLEDNIYLKNTQPITSMDVPKVVFNKKKLIILGV